MANEEHLAILRQGVKVWNQWREANRKEQPDLRGVALDRANWRGANLAGADLQSAQLFRANLHRADLAEAHLQAANLTRTSLWGANLRAAHLQAANLQEVNFRRADLTRADLTRADLTRAYLIGANLESAVLERAVLNTADLRQVVLTAANLNHADLRWAILDGAVLDGANLTQAIINRTMFTDVDLHDTHGLTTVYHRGPSTIGIDTLYRSKGQIPESFLRGCGVPDSMIAYARSLVAAERAIDYYSVFISYSSKDEALAERLYADLQAKGVRCWYAPHSLEIGEPILSGIDRGIRLHDKVLLILSGASVESAWIEQEVEMALARERTERRRVLFPIRIDDAVSEQTAGWPALVWSQRHVGDFQQWKAHDAYQQAFARLLKDLKAE